MLKRGVHKKFASCICLNASLSTLFYQQITTLTGQEFLLQADHFPTICKWHDALKKAVDSLVCHFLKDTFLL